MGGLGVALGSGVRVGLGVLVTGESGIGKSECALELIDRGHRLVADDVVEIKRMGDVLVGVSPDLTRFHMELRGLGVLNIKDLYGVSAMRLSKRVELVIQLERWEAGKEYDRLGLREKTLILFSADNGTAKRSRTLQGRELSGQKASMLDCGAHVPMIGSWKGTTPAGKTIRDLVDFSDLLVTFADLAGAERPGGSDGISVVPTLLGRPDKQGHRDYLYWEYHMGKQQAVRTGKWKGVRFGGTKEPIELYDLSRDVGETKNVADEHAEIIERMDELMRKARENSEFTAFWPLPEHRLEHIKYDKVIYDQLEKGIDWDRR